MAIGNRAPVYDQRYLKLNDNGDVMLSERNLHSEIMERLTAYRGTFPFDLTYGSRLHTIINARAVTKNTVHRIVEEALHPMVAQKRIEPDIEVLPVVLGRVATIKVKVRASDGYMITARYDSFLLG
jgi:hypothetical protein